MLQGMSTAATERETVEVVAVNPCANGTWIQVVSAILSQISGTKLLLNSWLGVRYPRVFLGRLLRRSTASSPSKNSPFPTCGKCFLIKESVKESAYSKNTHRNEHRNKRILNRGGPFFIVEKSYYCFYHSRYFHFWCDVGFFFLITLWRIVTSWLFYAITPWQYVRRSEITFPMAPKVT